MAGGSDAGNRHRLAKGQRAAPDPGIREGGESGRAYATFCVLARDPAALGDVEILVIRRAKLDLVVGPRARRAGVTSARAIRQSIGLRRCHLAAVPCAAARPEA